MNNITIIKAIFEDALVRDSVPSYKIGSSPKCGGYVVDMYNDHIEGCANEVEKLLYILGFVLDSAAERIKARGGDNA